MSDWQEAVLIGAISGCIVSVVGVIYHFFRHSRCTSDCCGRPTTLTTDLSPRISVRPPVIIPPQVIQPTVPTTEPTTETTTATAPVLHQQESVFPV